jgi:UDP-3-O-[3-hydroxymyristoyl] N-acetylglucosamine deacetylase
VLNGVGVHLDAAVAVPGATVIAGVSTVEHLLAALVGGGVTDAVIEVTGREVPILDGSARPWCEALAGVGLRGGPAASTLQVIAPVEWWDGPRGGRWSPHPGAVVSVAVDFGAADHLRGSAEIDLRAGEFAVEAGWARTFVMERDVERLRAAGLGRGASMANTVVVGMDGVVGTLRHPDEIVRHKLLDAVGDLALLGAPLRGRLEVVRGGHAVHHELVRALLETPGAWYLASPESHSATG